MEHDPNMEGRITEAFEEVGSALISMLAAAEKEDWELRHRAADALGKAAADVYRALCEADTKPAG